MKQRIAIVVLGLLIGLVARVASDVYHHYQARRHSPPAAATTPLPVRSSSTK